MCAVLVCSENVRPRDVIVAAGWWETVTPAPEVLLKYENVATE